MQKADETILDTELLGDGSRWGLDLHYAVQPSPGGLAQAFLIGRDFLGDHHAALVLGDNVFYGHELAGLVRKANQKEHGATVFTTDRDSSRFPGLKWLNPLAANG